MGNIAVFSFLVIDGTTTVDTAWHKHLGSFLLLF